MCVPKWFFNKKARGDKYKLAQIVSRVRDFVNTEVLVTRKLASV